MWPPQSGRPQHPAWAEQTLSLGNVTTFASVSHRAFLLSLVAAGALMVARWAKCRTQRSWPRNWQRHSPGVCVPGSQAGGCVAWVGHLGEPMAVLCACLCTAVFTWRQHRGQGGGRREGRQDWYGCEPLSPHPCTRALGLREQLQSLWEELEQMAQKGRARRAQSAELNSDLCKAHRWVPLPWRPGRAPGSL